MQKLCLIILDGWGVGDANNSNPICAASTPSFDTIEKYFPKTALQASGLAVGLPWGEPGNSEVGHLNIGAGFIPYQALPRINNAIKDGSFFTNTTLKEISDRTRKNNSAVHIMGLLTSGSVHAYIDHIYALVEWAENENLQKVYLHLFTDGRDSLPQEASRLIAELFSRIKGKHAQIATVSGRMYGMDRDNRWERTKKLYDLLTMGTGGRFDDPIAYIKSAYQTISNDEFIEPAGSSNWDFTIKDNDSIIFFNYREDSARQITKAFVTENFKGFKRERYLKNIYFATMTEYEKGLNAHILFSPLLIEYPLARVIAEAKLRQLHIAETDKYAHITYFLNGLREAAFEKEGRILVPSVAADKLETVPEMSSREITQNIISAITTKEFDFVAANFANGDMIGHTGNFDAALKAVEAVDACIGEILNVALQEDWIVVITADHGNVEAKRDLITGETLTEHTENPVPLYIVGNAYKKDIPTDILLNKDRANGILADVAPTILELMGIKKPPTMTGESLLKQILY